MRISPVFFPIFCLAAILSAIGYAASTPDPLTPDQQAAVDAAVKDFSDTNQSLQTQAGINDKLFNPLMNSGTLMTTMDGSKSFAVPLLCQKKVIIVQTSLSPASNGEMNITIAYDPTASGTLTSNFTITNIAAACTGGAVYNCQNGWDNCKNGVLKQVDGIWTIDPNFPSGLPRSVEGMTGCFCFSNYCGGSANLYTQQIQTTIAQPIADFIAKTGSNMYASVPEYDETNQTVTWYAGNVDDCSLQSVSDLTAQNNKMDLDYTSALHAAQEDPESPWSLSTSGAESYNQATCVITNKVSSDWRIVERTMPTDMWIGWDTNGGTKDCFYVFPGPACGTLFGQTGDFGTCQSIGMQPVWLASACNTLYVNGGHFISISDITNVKVGGLTTMWATGIACNGAGDPDSPDQAIPLHVDCVGKRYNDYFVCDSANKSQPGQILYNYPYSVSAYNGCDEVHPSINGCTSFEQNPDCKLVKEITDGAMTVSGSVITGATVPSTCKIIQGAQGSITVCEPWWTKTRTYQCSDVTIDFNQARQRVNYVGANTTLSGDKYLAQMNDLVFSGDGSQPVATNYMLGVQFATTQDPCSPSCIVQQTVPNYSIILPEKQVGTTANPDSPEYGNEPSVVPSGTQTIINSLECTFKDDKYTCPVPAGWTVRSQCSCGDGKEFVNAISALAIVNQIAKDVICSSGKEAGICDTPSEQVNYPVICGNVSETSGTGSTDQTGAGSASNYTGTLVEGKDYWLCQPAYWTGKTASPQIHDVTLSNGQTCVGSAKSATSAETTAKIDIGLVYPQRSWFAPVIEWAEQKIKEFLSADTEFWMTPDGCGCGTLKSNEIPVCKQEQSGYTCLANNNYFDTIQNCNLGCQNSRATSLDDKTCIWHDVLKSGNFDFTYNLGNHPGQEEAYGNVAINAGFVDSSMQIDCMNESEKVEVYFEQRNCVDNSIYKVFNGPPLRPSASQGYCMMYRNEILYPLIWNDEWGTKPTFEQVCSLDSEAGNYCYVGYLQKCIDLPTEDGWTVPYCYYYYIEDDTDKIAQIMAEMTGVTISWQASFGCGDSCGICQLAYNMFPYDLQSCVRDLQGLLNTALQNTCNYAVNNHYLDHITSKSLVNTVADSGVITNWYNIGMCGDNGARQYAEYVPQCVQQDPKFNCEINASEFQSQSECMSGCKKTRYLCKPSGLIVDDPSQCQKKYTCPTTQQTFTDAVSCKQQCNFTVSMPATHVKCSQEAQPVELVSGSGTCTGGVTASKTWYGPTMGVGRRDEVNWYPNTNFMCEINPSNYSCNGVVDKNGNQISNCADIFKYDLSTWNTLKTLVTPPGATSTGSGPICCQEKNGQCIGPANFSYCKGFQGPYGPACTNPTMSDCINGAQGILDAMLNSSCDYAVTNGILNNISNKTLKDLGGATVNTPATCLYDVLSMPVEYFQAVCTGTQSDYVCDSNNTHYTSQTECQAVCNNTKYRCLNTGEIVSSPSQCPKQYHCSTNGTTFADSNQCDSQCWSDGGNGETGNNNCANVPDMPGFVAYLKANTALTGYDMILKEIPVGDTDPTDLSKRIDVATDPYTHADLILAQCISQYTQPYIKFDEPGTNAHFEFSYMDANIYQIAGLLTELPMDVTLMQLPTYPPVYMGSIARAYQIQLMKLYTTQVNADGTVTKIPNANLTDEQKAAITGVANVPAIDENGAYIANSAGMMQMVPRKPMFTSKTMTNSVYDPTGGLAGHTSFTATNLLSSVYYYGCPQGIITDDNSCGGKPPWGGMANTIQGPKCFQYFCDENAKFETNASQNSGCGLINDGTLVPATN